MSSGINFLAGWTDDLIWCPSQCERVFTIHQYAHKLTLYCRWRHEDPWIFSFFDYWGDIWVDLGEGLNKDTPIIEVHAYAEMLLKAYVKNMDIQAP